MTEWKNCTISDLGNIIGGATPSTKNPTYYDGGEIPWITPKDLADFQGRYISHGKRNITEAGLRSCSAQMLPAHTILFSSRAPIGYIAIAANSVCTNQGFKSVIPNDNTDYLFLYYLMKYYKHVIEGMGSGTTFKEVSAATMRGIKVRVPKEKRDQHRIAAFLSALDDKIEINNQINKNLEQQAQSIYEEFLSNHQTFPVTIGDIVLMANTGADAIQKAPIVDYDTGIRCVRVGDLSNQRPVYEWGFTKVTSEIFKRYQLHKDDIVVTRTASLGLNQLIGEDLNAVYNNGLIRISINDDIVYPLIVYRQFQTKDYRNYISRITGETSVRPNMKINYLLKYKFEILEKAEQTELVHIIQPLFEAQERNTSENLLLLSLRDALLPKLMTGELDVSDLNF